MLGTLVERQSYPYEIANRLKHLLGPDAGLEPPDLYPIVARLERDGLIEVVERVREPGQRQARIVYRATPAGARAFDDWIRTGSRPSPRRGELLTKLAVARPGDIPALLEQLAEAEEHLLALLESADDLELAFPDGSWQQLIVDAQRDHALAHWQAELRAIGSIRRRLETFEGRERARSR